MIEAFTEGFVLGLGAAVPVGPVNILIMTKALKNYTNAVSIGFGAMSADITYLTLILFGFFVFVKNGTFQTALGIFGTLFLIYISFLIFKNRNEKVTNNNDGSKNEKNKIFSNYIKGYTITLLNPYTIGFWISVSAYITTKSLSFGYTLLGLFLAIGLWITVMPFIIHKTKHLFSQTLTKNISVVSAGILLFFAAGMIISTF